MSEVTKFMPADADPEAYFRARAEGHVPGVEIAVYARPAQWTAVADAFAERAALQNGLRNARRCVAENPDPRHALDIIDAALTGTLLAKEPPGGGLP